MIQFTQRTWHRAWYIFKAYRTETYGREQTAPRPLRVRPPGIGVISGSQRMKAANPDLMPAWPCRVVVTINKKRNLVVSVEDGATFEIVLHRTWKGSAVHQDFLGFYVLDSFRMSARTQGLLGMTGQPGRTVCVGALRPVCAHGSSMTGRSPELQRRAV